jgi:hypothetical protein
VGDVALTCTKTRAGLIREPAGDPPTVQQTRKARVREQSGGLENGERASRTTVAPTAPGSADEPLRSEQSEQRSPVAATHAHQ